MKTIKPKITREHVEKLVTLILTKRLDELFPEGTSKERTEAVILYMTFLEIIKNIFNTIDEFYESKQKSTK